MKTGKTKKWKVTLPLTATDNKTEELINVTFILSLSNQLKPPPQPTKIPIILTVEKPKQIDEDLMEMWVTAYTPPTATGVATLRIHQPKPTNVTIQTPYRSLPLSRYVGESVENEATGRKFEFPDEGLSISVLYTLQGGEIVEFIFYSDYILPSPKTSDLILSVVEEVIDEVVRHYFNTEFIEAIVLPQLPSSDTLEFTVPISIKGPQMIRDFLVPREFKEAFSIQGDKETIQSHLTDEKFIVTWLKINEREVLERILNSVSPETSRVELEFEVKTLEELVEEWERE